MQPLRAMAMMFLFQCQKKLNRVGCYAVLLDKIKFASLLSSSQFLFGSIRQSKIIIAVIKAVSHASVLSLIQV